MLPGLLITRGISTSAVRHGKRNFRKFQLFNKRGSRIHKEQQCSPNRKLEIDKRGVRDVGYTLEGKFYTVPEMIPELVVPDLTGFKLKPYVSYRAPDIVQTEFTAEYLFNTVYADKIAEDFKNGKLNHDGTPKEPSVEEKLTPEQAKLKAAQTGTDIF